jgi:hypothetical protein
MIISPVRKSRLPIGSSASRALGSPTSAREDPRCCYPPDNSPVRCDARFRNPTSSNLAIDTGSTSSLLSPRPCRPPERSSAASQYCPGPVRFKSIYPFSSFRRRCFGAPGCWDVFKALALGARAVGVGRPFLWGLGAFGQGPRAISKDPNLLAGRILARALLLSEGHKRLVVARGAIIYKTWSDTQAGLERGHEDMRRKALQKDLFSGKLKPDEVEKMGYTEDQVRVRVLG